MPELLQEHFGGDGDWAEKSERVVNAGYALQNGAFGGCGPE